MDFLKPAGFLWLGFLNARPNYPTIMRSTSQCCEILCDYFPSTCSCRLCVWVVMNMAPDSFLMLAPVCSTWGLPNRGTSKRSFVNPFGNPILPSVREANQMMSRTLDRLVDSVDSTWSFWQVCLIMRARPGQQLCLGLGATRELAGRAMEML